MNYLAHGHRHLDRPWVLAGTALPDWLSVADRRSRLVPPDEAPADPQAADLLAGVRQHLADDERFHGAPAFLALEQELTLALRALHADEPRQRSRFLAHVLVEQLLDAWLMARDPQLLPRYFAALDALDGRRLGAHCAPWLSRPAIHLEHTLERFRQTRFLEGYRRDDHLAERLAGVARRVGLPPLAPGLVALLPRFRRRVAAAGPALLAASGVAQHPTPSPDAPRAGPAGIH